MLSKLSESVYLDFRDEGKETLMIDYGQTYHEMYVFRT